MKIFSISGHYTDDPEQEVSGLLIAEAHSVTEGYTDADIYFYGLSEANIKQIIKDGEDIEGFVPTSYRVEADQ